MTYSRRAAPAACWILLACCSASPLLVLICYTRRLAARGSYRATRLASSRRSRTQLRALLLTTYSCTINALWVIGRLPYRASARSLARYGSDTTAASSIAVAAAVTPSWFRSLATASLSSRAAAAAVHLRSSPAFNITPLLPFTTLLDARHRRCGYYDWTAFLVCSRAAACTLRVLLRYRLTRLPTWFRAYLPSLP